MSQKEGLPQETVQTPRKILLDKLLVQPNPFREVLGLKMAPEQPFGTFDEDILEFYLRAIGVEDENQNPKKMKRDESRRLAREITEPFRKGESTAGLFPVPAGIRILGTREGNEVFYHRSDISPTEAVKRAKEVKKFLKREIEIKSEKARNSEEQRAKEIKESKTKRETKKRAAKLLEKRRSDAPPNVRVILISSYNQEYFDKKVAALHTENPNFIPESPEFTGEHIADPGARILHFQDIQKILKEGIQPENFSAFLSSVRLAAISSIERIETLEGNAADFVLNQAANIKTRGEELKMAIKTNRATSEVLRFGILHKNTNPNLVIEEDYPFALGAEAYPAPIALIRGWAERFDPELLSRFLERLKLLDIPKWNHFHQAIKGEEGMDVLKKFFKEGQAVTQDQTLKYQDYACELANLILPDDFLARAIFTDIIGGIYPSAFVFQGTFKEQMLLSMRYLADRFDVDAIKILLSPVPDKAKSQEEEIAIAKEMLAQINSQINGLTSQTPEIRQKRKELETRRNELTRSWREAVAGKKRQLSPQDIIEETLDILAQPKAGRLDPRNYYQGENSLGYLRETKRYDQLKERFPRLIPPDPDNFVNGEKSLGYRGDRVTRNSINDITISGRVDKKRLRKLRMDPQLTFSLIGEPLLKG